MADEREEAEEITAICGGLHINIGTLNQNTIPSMFLAGKKANELGHPVLLDPVGAGASVLRTKTAAELLKEVKFTAVRGNISEMKALAFGRGTTRGVDADVADAVTEENLAASAAFVKGLAEQWGCVVAVTGAIDLVADADICYAIRNGRPEMGRITGTGCQLSGLMTAYLTANPGKETTAAAAAVCLMGLAGELALAKLQSWEGNASYRNRIIDAICRIDGKMLEEGAKYEVR